MVEPALNYYGAMQSFLNLSISRRVFARLTCLLVCLGASVTNPVSGADAIERQFATRVAPGTHTALQLRAVQAGTQIELRLGVGGSLRVLLLDELNIALFPAHTRALYEARLEGKGEAKLLPPSTGDYFVVFDNRDGRSEVPVDVEVRISAAELAAIEQPALKASMDQIVSSLASLFVFDNIVIQPAACGFANLLTVDDTIYLCIEYVTALSETVGDREAAKSLLLFAILHELGHVLLRQWNMPFYDNEELADQFATAIATMINRSDVAIRQARFFAASTTSQGDHSGNSGLGRHPLAAQRARNIERWVESGDRHVEAWQTFLVPRMQTGFLRQLRARPRAWANPGLIADELASRETEGL